jgi:hypothetical protein
MVGPRRRWLLSQAKRLFVWLVVLGLLVVAAGLVWLGTPYRGTEAGVAAVEAGDDLVVERTAGGGYVLRPPGPPTETGLVFYPGARVHPDAYLASLAPLASEGEVTVAVAKPPLNFALLDHRAADGLRVRHSGVERWYVGGHSLGGVAACRYASAADGAVVGLVLYASYCDADVSERDLRVLAVTGTADTVLDTDRYRAARAALPAGAREESLEGLNHSQFGDYRGQPGDEPSGLGYDVAHERLANATLTWLRGGG